jgi:hypothetical protein
MRRKSKGKKDTKKKPDQFHLTNAAGSLKLQKKKKNETEKNPVANISDEMAALLTNFIQKLSSTIATIACQVRNGNDQSKLASKNRQRFTA